MSNEIRERELESTTGVKIERQLLLRLNENSQSVTRSTKLT